VAQAFSPVVGQASSLAVGFHPASRRRLWIRRRRSVQTG